ncbi:MAG: 2,4-dihydroxyhept-2-ene-1,7-dioic acid aldolase [Desulfovibrio sp.]|jgi:2-dehydro-3-deoxyglucarate aldolase|nr:2,4-dihydroxyhept-2-ene-1,7-dioic acid aldolase [Desulfovibrio sp.]
MSTNREVRQKLRVGKACLGTWLQIPSPETAEIIARMGYEWAAVDAEHGAFTRAALPDMFRALERWGTLPFVRTAGAKPELIKYALDSGAAGLIFPMIESRAQLDEAISFSLYPGGEEFPGGRRGVGFCRANAYGLDFDAHMEPRSGFGRETVLVAQIEHINAVTKLDEIFSHPRLDAYMVGPYDLSASMGLTACFDDPEFKKTLERIEAKAVQYGISRGYHVVRPDEALLREKIRAGYSFLAYGMDSLFIQTGGKPPAL